MLPPSSLLSAARRSVAAGAGVGRRYHGTPRARMAYKDSQDRQSLRPRSAEHTTSARDDDAARDPAVAFDPRKTDPESEARAAEARSGGGTPPLEASGLNQQLSKPRGDERSSADRGAGTEVRKGGRSGDGSAPKSGRPGRA